MNLPNKLTIMRIALIPFMMFFYFANFIPFGIGKIVALAIFIVAALTDLIDGKIARKYNLITDFGKFLDPIADKILTSAVLFMLLADGTIMNPWGAIIVTIIMTREFLVASLRMIAAEKGIVLAADIWGKAKTFVQMIALPIFMLLAWFFSCGLAIPAVITIIVMVLGYLSLGAATVLTIISGINYFIKNKDCFKGSTK